MFAISLYLALTLGLGIYAARRVKNATDYVNASRGLPLYMSIATVFATWFGSETVLGAPAVFIEEGLGGIVADPFGATLCLVLVGLFFARPLYRLKLLTLADFYKQRYGRGIELTVAMAICISYLGWVAAQISAMGLVFHLLAPAYISVAGGMVFGTALVLTYTLLGGMWSVALTDTLQMAIIMVGLVCIAVFLGQLAGGPQTVLASATAAGHLGNFWPAPTLAGILGFVGALVTLGLGSIPQQDIFQRATAAKNEDIAARGAILGGGLYFIFALIPLFIMCAALVIDPALVAQHLSADSQYILPQLILTHTPLWVQILFFGALLSAIMSTAAATLLAPSVTLAENILRPLLPPLTPAQLLKLIRVTVLVFAAGVLLFALNSGLSIFEMVENAYKVTLVAAFVPLVAGLYWRRANRLGAWLSIILGVGTWLTLEALAPAGICPPQLAGLFAAMLGMLAGGYAQPSVSPQSPAISR